MSPYQSIADVLGPWREADFDSGLIERCRQAWTKPTKDLTNQELATLLRQRIAVNHLLPFARQRVVSGVSDDTELYKGELAAAVEHAAPVFLTTRFSEQKLAVGLVPNIMSSRASLCR